MKKLTAKKGNEKVMVVGRGEIFKVGIWQGLKSENIAKYLLVISKNHRFLPRSKVEEDGHWQQIIPYIVFKHKEKIFLMRRKASHTDSRLSNKYSIGVGGHVNKADIGRGDIISWAKREFNEEVSFGGKFKARFLGLLNDDSNEVGLVHLGLVIVVEGNSDKIAVRDEHKEGKLVELVAARKFYNQMETWSQIVYDALSQNGKMKTKNKNSFQFSGILPDWIIEDYIERGAIKITSLTPDWRKAIDQVSIDFHLGGNIKLFRGGTYRFVDTRKGLPEDAMEEVNLTSGDPFILEPGAFAIASTLEVLKLPADVLGRLEGKSSLARLGILVHSTAARFDPGWNGAPVLELGNLGPKPAILYCGMPICAFTFEKIAAPVRTPYEGSSSDRYSGSKKAIASRIHKASAKTGKDGKR